MKTVIGKAQSIEELYKYFQSKNFREDIANCVKSKGSKGMDYLPMSLLNTM